MSTARRPAATPAPAQHDARATRPRLLDSDALPGRLALKPAEAAEAIGCSRTFFDEHVLPELRTVYRGTRRIIPVRELVRWLDENATRI